MLRLLLARPSEPAVLDVQTMSAWYAQRNGPPPPDGTWPVHSVVSKYYGVPPIALEAAGALERYRRMRRL